MLSKHAKLLTIVALLACIAALKFSGDVRYDAEPGVRLELPVSTGPWRGEDVLFCQLLACGKGFSVSELNGATNCPACGGALGRMAAAEFILLPLDTHVRHTTYTAPGRPTLGAILVLGGKTRASIHRPEVCLVGGGSRVVRSETILVAVPGRPPLPLRVLTMRHGNTGRPGYSYFAYWFVTKDHETASHMDRMAIMAADRVFRGVTHRWAYVSIAGPLDSERADPGPELREFLAAFVPQLAPR